MANGKGEPGAVQGVEVKLIDTVLPEMPDLLDGDICGNQAAGTLIVLKTLE
jgi:hypothetical protein